MKKDRWTCQLGIFKEEENPEAVLLVADNAALMRIVVAWQNMRVERKQKLSKLDKETEDSTWRWLWDNTRYSQADFLARIPGCDSSTSRKIDALIANRVIYPDGDANGYVEKYLRHKVATLFGTRGRTKEDS